MIHPSPKVKWALRLGGRGRGCCAQDAKAAVTRERGTPGQGSQAQARDGGPWVQLPSLDPGGSGGSCLGWVGLEVELPLEDWVVRMRWAWRL